MPPVSFVVIAYNEEASIEQTLASILAQDGEHIRVIVVDDCSTDDTAELVESMAARNRQLTLVQLPANSGRGFARATGITAASGHFVAMVDGDIVLPPDWLKRCLAEIENNDAVGGTASPDGDVAYLARRYGIKPRVVSHRTTVTGSNALYRRELFDRVQFDGSLRNGEDVAFNHAMAAAGARFATVPGLVVLHNEHKSFQQSVRWLFESGRGASRQLATFRRIRLPDVAFLAWTSAWVFSASLAKTRRGPLLHLPLALTTLIASTHMVMSFEISGSPPAMVLEATLTDALFLTSYFGGRLIGTLENLVSPHE